MPIRRPPPDSQSAPIGDDLSSELVALKPYAIGTAARLAGIPPETLRIWERRYEILAPGRSEGGHRLYSEDDVAILRAVKELVDAGMRIGSVARMEKTELLAAAAQRRPASAVAAPLASTTLVDEVLAAAPTLDASVVGPLLDRPLLISPGAEVVTSIYLPLLARIGDLWHRGLIPVRVEHFVEKLVTSRIHAILQATPQPSSGRLALCACPPDERHEVGLLAAALSLKTQGFDVTVLGADLPVPDLARAAQTLAPAVVVLAVTNSLSDGARQALPALDAPPLRDIPLLVGGPQARELTTLLRRPATVVERVSDTAAAAWRALS